MTPLIDPELVVHLFAPLDGPRSEQAFAQLRRIWLACRDHLGMTEAIRGLPVSAAMPPTLAGMLGDGLVAAQENAAGDRQSVLRQVHDVLNLSVALAQPVPEGRATQARGAPRRPWHAAPPTRHRLGWAEFGQLWVTARGQDMGALLGETRLFLARQPPPARGALRANPELGESVDPLLPYGEDRPRGWWRWGTTVAGGYAAWDTRLSADDSPLREIILIGGADQDEDLSVWAWSDGSASLPPFARYLMHATRLRYEARLLAGWHRHRRDSEDGDALAELDAVLAPGEARPGRAELLGSLLARVRAKEGQLTRLAADLTRLRQTVVATRSNLRASPGCEADGDADWLFAADQALARWLISQISGDLRYLQIDLDRAGRVKALAAEELAQLQPSPTSGREPGSPAAAARGLTRSFTSVQEVSGASGQPDIRRRVFVVHGRDRIFAARIRDLLHAVGLEPLDWQTLVDATGSTVPFLGEVVRQAPHLGQATLVLLSPDDIVALHSDLFRPNDLPHERARTVQARPNVYFELGLALGAYPDRTVVVEAGRMRPVGDLAGLNVIRFDGSVQAVKNLLDRLIQAGCPVNFAGTDWLDPGRFAGLATYERGPATDDDEQGS